jgi:hypothetical protein
MDIYSRFLHNNDLRHQGVLTEFEKEVWNTFEKEYLPALSQHHDHILWKKHQHVAMNANENQTSVQPYEINFEVQLDDNGDPIIVGRFKRIKRRRFSEEHRIDIFQKEPYKYGDPIIVANIIEHTLNKREQRRFSEEHRIDILQKKPYKDGAPMTSIIEHTHSERRIDILQKKPYKDGAPMTSIIEHTHSERGGRPISRIDIQQKAVDDEAEYTQFLTDLDDLVDLKCYEQLEC